MYARTILLACLLWCCLTSAAGADTVSELDASLARKADYVAAKEQLIGKLRQRMGAVRSDHERYQMYIGLYDQYKSYKYDSAHVYALKSLGLAERLGRADFVAEARCAVTFCLSSAGLYKEAFDELEPVDPLRLTDPYKRKYYWTASRLYYDAADYNHSMPYLDDYIRQGSIYTDSLLSYLDSGSADWLYAVGMRQMKEFSYDECTATLKRLLKLTDVDAHTRAVVTSSLGWISLYQEHRDDAKRYLAEAAICDNETATKETTALCMLASILYEDGDVERATRYVQLSLDDANYYDARQRKIQVGAILPIIEQDRYNIVKSQRNSMIVANVAVSLLVVILLAGILIIRRQIKKLQQARQIIEERNRELTTANTQLHEANKIKDEYIGKTFYLNAEYINKVEKLYKTIDRKITTKQYEDLRSSLKESTLDAERKSMFADFDETFLKLFPDFVGKFNALFAEKDRRQPEDEHSLTSEMRIFALIRLGITDSERIANFLDYSVHTINTYKTRVKNKSTVDNDAFEQHIMSI